METAPALTRFLRAQAMESAALSTAEPGPETLSNPCVWLGISWSYRGVNAGLERGYFGVI